MRPLLVAKLADLVGLPVAAAIVPTYFSMAAIAALVAVGIAVRRARRDGDDVSTLLAALAWGYAAALLCGILAPMLADMVQQALDGRFPRPRWAGMLAYGGFVGGLATAAIVLRRSKKITLARFADLVAAPIGVAIALVRVGCFIAGCDYGKVTDVPWAVRFPAGSSAFADHVRAGLVPPGRTASLPVHPTQLYEALLGMALFVGVTFLARKRRQPGTLFLVAAASYAIGRSVIETLRGDASRGFFGPVSTSQLISILVLLAIGAAVFAARRRVAGGLALGLLLFGAASPAHADERGFDAAVLVGSNNAMNRQSDQVPQLAGFSFVGTFVKAPKVGFGIELDIFSNSIASHDSLVFSYVMRNPVTPKLDLGLRAGIGGTLIDFHDESFAEVLAFDMRAAFAGEYRFAPGWALVAWPAAIEWISSGRIGGPIVSYQFRVGVSYHFGAKKAQTVPAQPQVPPPQPQPQPYPPQPQPYPPQPQPQQPPPDTGPMR